MKKQNLILSMTLAALFSSLSVFAEAEVTGQIIYEHASFAESGTSTGDTNAHGKSSLKDQIQAKVFVDGEINDDNAYHVELQAFRDGKAVDSYDDNQQYTQRDFLREAYIDTEIGDWSIRTGKQQVVWGTADGIKLLDLINPTDYSEVNQNVPEDARIPVWMINVEKDFENGGNFQAIISQPRENVFAGLNRDIDTSVRGNDLANATAQGIPDIAGIGHNQGHPFIFKGVDTITGQRNGFLNIAPDLGSVAAGFGANFLPPNGQGFGGLSSNPVAGVTPGNSLVNHFTVGAFTSGASLADIDGGFKQLQQGAWAGNDRAFQTTYIASNCQPGAPLSANANCATLFNPASTETERGAAFTALVTAVNTAGFTPFGFDNFKFGQTVAGLACQNPQYTASGSPGATQCANLGSTTPATTVQAAVTAIFAEVGAGFTGKQVLAAFGQGYASNLYNPDAEKNSAFEYMELASFATFDTFVNAGSQYIFDMPDDADANVAFRWKNTTEKGLNYSLNYSYNYDTNPVIDLSWRNNAGEVLDKNIVSVNTDIVTTAGAQTLTGYHIELTDKAGNQYGGANNRSAILTFEQTLERAHNIGGSLDYSLDTKDFGAVVLRAEGLYQKDVYSPIIDKSRLSFGDLTDALEMIPGDRFKFVLGADITVATNMLVSLQFIQDRNLDYVDGKGALDAQCVAGVAALNAPPTQGGSGLSLDANNVCAKYTADFASMHLTNGLLKAEENKNFISLFLSKPFGASGEHRWNNIVIFEDQGSGGYWNRLDMEYSLNDDMQLTAEYNKYWGEENSQFGQLESSSNVQVGFKYAF